jgi:hypothetical protein
MQEIVDFDSLHYSTVNRLIKEGDKNARNESPLVLVLENDASRKPTLCATIYTKGIHGREKTKGVCL